MQTASDLFAIYKTIVFLVWDLDCCLDCWVFLQQQDVFIVRTRCKIKEKLSSISCHISSPFRHKNVINVERNVPLLAYQ